MRIRFALTVETSARERPWPAGAAQLRYQARPVNSRALHRQDFVVAMLMIQYIFNSVISIYTLVIFVMVIMSWLISFNVVNRHNQFVDMVYRTCVALTEPLLRPIRNVLPSMGGLDISPIVLLIGMNALQAGLNHYVFNPMIRSGL